MFEDDLDKLVGSMTYRLASDKGRKGDRLYVNVTPDNERVISCVFDDPAVEKLYEQNAGASLRLNRAPKLYELMHAIDNCIRRGFFHRTDEIVFAGLGDPLLNFGLVNDAIDCLRDMDFRGRIRLDTYGFADHNYKGIFYINPAGELKRSGLDEIRISLNARNAEEYKLLCRPKRKNAFPYLLNFIGSCLRAGLDTYISFMVGFEKDGISTARDEEYLIFARECLRLRDENVLLESYSRRRLLAGGK